eukprot:TRINITY_DN3461_c1_g1_i1.p1 TRINITY_DN3461_c1_g1~~TRINITY_DN3461_c1_g1_i1.p1  ORF type:complete len:845 (+),score=271.49 TRINITY_DN3461_c1_g1_i1:317-2536(+)
MDAFEKKITSLLLEKLKDEKGIIQLFLFVGTEDGEIYSWIWKEDKWKFISKNNISFINKSKTQNLVLCDETSPFFVSIDVIENSNNNNNNYRLLKKTLKPSENGLEMGINQVLTTSFKDPVAFFPGNKGVWIVCEKEIIFYEFISKIHTLNIKTPIGKETEQKKINEEEIPLKKQRSQMEDVLHYYFNQSTKELVLLESTGLVTICSFHKNQILAISVCRLQDFSPQNKVRDFTLIYHTLAVSQSNNSIQFYDINTGFMIDQKMINNSKKNFKNFWKCSHFSDTSSKENSLLPQFGFIDNYDGIWQIIHPTIVSLASRQKSCQLSSKICSQWGLKKLEAKYLLEEATNDKNDVDFQRKLEICEELLPLLSNPSLTIAILSEDSFYQKRFKKQIEEFLLKFDPPLSNEKSNQKLSAQNSFHLFTSLNESLYPILKNYLSVINEFENLHVKKEIEIKKKSVTEISRDKLEYLYLTNPSNLFNDFFQQLDLNSVLNGTISKENSSNLVKLLFTQFKYDDRQSTSSFVPYFDILSFLFYIYKPNKLYVFLDYLQNFFNDMASQEKISSEISASSLLEEKSSKFFIFERCLSNLPPLLHHDDYQNINTYNIGDSPFGRFKPNDEQLDAYIQIMCKVNRARDALKLMLYNFDNWNKAIQILEKRMNQDTEHYELFHLAVGYCFKFEEPKKIGELWKYMPRNFSVLQLLRIIKNFIPSDGSCEITSGKDQYSISLFYDQLKKMLQK